MDTVATELQYLCVGGRVCPRSYRRLTRARSNTRTASFLKSGLFGARRWRGRWSGGAVCDIIDTPRSVRTLLQPLALLLCCAAFWAAPAATSSSSSPFTFFSLTRPRAAFSRLRSRSQSAVRSVRRTQRESGDLFPRRDAQMRLIGPGLNRTSGGF